MASGEQKVAVEYITLNEGGEGSALLGDSQRNSGGSNAECCCPASNSLADEMHVSVKHSMQRIRRLAASS